MCYFTIFILMFILLGCNNHQIVEIQNNKTEFRSALDPLSKLGEPRSPHTCNQIYLAWQIEHTNLFKSLEDQNQLGILQSHSRVVGHLQSLFEKCNWYLAKTYQKEYESLIKQSQSFTSPRILLKKYQQLEDKIKNSWNIRGR